MRILAVDDEKIALEVLVSSIKNADPSAEVISFDNPKDALEFVKDTPCETAFLDIQMRHYNGIRLAQEMKILNPHVNIVFATGYDEYMEEAFGMHASGYVRKPITPEKVWRELTDLRYVPRTKGKKRVRFQTFGSFEMFVDEKTVSFRYDKTKEMVAYLVDREGSLCSNNEIMARLWQDDHHASYLRRSKKDLMDTMGDLECADIVVQAWGRIGILTQKVDCDYYDWKKGKPYALNAYIGEYMAQYEWAELTNGGLAHSKKK